MLELIQLEHLAAVARYGTLSRAAEALHTSQPVLSRTMQKLEEELQVSLFDRQKNKLTLNQNGEIAVRHAENVLEEVRRMVHEVRSFDRSQRTILIGSCAPAPLWELLPLVTQFFPDMTISSEMKNSSVLLDGLREGVYKLIVLTERIEDDSLYCQRYGEEQLYLALPPAHPLAVRREGVWLKEIDGERMLLYADIGFWHEWSRKMLPSTYFLLQQKLEDFSELVSSSALPSFASDLALRCNPCQSSRVHIPILDLEAHVTYYCLCRAEDQRLLAPLLREMEERGCAGSIPEKA